MKCANCCDCREFHLILFHCVRYFLIVTQIFAYFIRSQGSARFVLLTVNEINNVHFGVASGLFGFSIYQQSN